MRGISWGVALGVFAVMFLNGCASARSPVSGFLWTDVRGPIMATGNTGEGTMKVGRAEAKSILGWFATGDCSIRAAMEDGGITKIHHVDHHSKIKFGIIASYETIVHGW